MDSQTNALFDTQTFPLPKYGLSFNAKYSPKPTKAILKSPSSKKFVMISAKDEESPSSSFNKSRNFYKTRDPSLTFSSPNMLMSPKFQNHLNRSGSYVFNEGASAKLYSDATSIRSLVSIGMGSTDGRKMVIRKVPNSPTELLYYINPPT